MKNDRLLQARRAFAMTTWTVFFDILFSIPYAYAESNFARVEKLFLEGRYEKSVNEALGLIDSKHSQRDELYYIIGLSELKLSRFDDARESFDSIISRYPKSKRMFDAHLGIADAYFLEGGEEKALKLYDAMLKDFPEDRNISIIHERIKGCHRKPSQSAMVSSQRREVQVGCFKNRKNAERLVKKLSKDGYKGYVEPPSQHHDNLYRVKVKEPDSSQGPEGLVSRLKNDGYDVKICDE